MAASFHPVAWSHVFERLTQTQHFTTTEWTMSWSHFSPWRKQSSDDIELRLHCDAWFTSLSPASHPKWQKFFSWVKWLWELEGKSLKEKVYFQVHFQPTSFFFNQTHKFLSGEMYKVYLCLHQGYTVALEKVKISKSKRKKGLKKRTQIAFRKHLSQVQKKRDENLAVMAGSKVEENRCVFFQRVSEATQEACEIHNLGSTAVKASSFWEG